MSRRNTYLLGGLAVLVGVAMVVVAIAGLVSDGDDPSPGSERTAPEVPVTTGSPGPPGGQPDDAPAPSGTEAEGAGIREQLTRRRPVRAPDFSAPEISDGAIPGTLAQAYRRAGGEGTLDMSDLRGTPVVLHLWSSRCAPCRSDARLVEATWKRWGPRGVLFVGISVNEPPRTAEPVIRQYDLTYPAVSDQNGQIAARYGATALPQTFFVSAAGDIVGEVAGSPSVRQLQLGTEAAAAGRPFGSEQGSSRVPLR
jgi:peroxiredoxin